MLFAWSSLGFLNRRQTSGTCQPTESLQLDQYKGNKNTVPTRNHGAVAAGRVGAHRETLQRSGRTTRKSSASDTSGPTSFVASFSSWVSSTDWTSGVLRTGAFLVAVREPLRHQRSGDTFIR